MKQGKIYRAIKLVLPNADENLIESLVAKVERETSGTGKGKARGLIVSQGTIERIIVHEELAQLGLKES